MAWLSQRPTVRRFGLNLIVHVTAVLLVAAGFTVMFGMPAGTVGLWGASSSFGDGVALLVPAIVLSSALLAAPSAARLSRFSAGLVTAAIYGLSVAAVTSLMSSQAASGPRFDPRPAIVVVTVFGLVAGLVAGAWSVGLHRALSKPPRRTEAGE